MLTSPTSSSAPRLRVAPDDDTKMLAVATSCIRPNQLAGPLSRVGAGRPIALVSQFNLAANENEIARPMGQKKVAKNEKKLK